MSEYDQFVSQACAILGNDIDREWLSEMWQGADSDLNRALNHVIDTPPNKIRRGGGGGAAAKKSAAVGVGGSSGSSPKKS